MSDEYRPRTTLSGAVIQSGLNAGPLKHEDPVLKDLFGLYRGVVLETYAGDDVGPDSHRDYEVECDLMLKSPMGLIPLNRVTVLQRGSDPNNEGGLWKPTATTGTISGSPLHIDGAQTPFADQTPLDDLNGTHVVVQFVNGDLEYPVITGGLTHPSTKRKVTDGPGWDSGGSGGSTEDDQRGKPQLEEWFSSHFGTELRINADGDLLVDAKGAFSDREDETGTGGEIRFRIKDSKKLTIQVGGVDVLEVWDDGGQVKVDLGEGAAEQMVRGNRLVAWLLTHTHPDAFGSTAAATNPTLSGLDLNDALTDVGRVT